MDISDYRNKIAEIDEQLVKLFIERMQVAGERAQFKEANDMPVRDLWKEREKLDAVTDMAGDDLGGYGRLLYSLILDMSHSYENRVLGHGNKLADDIEHAIKNTPRLFPEHVSVACQGTEGAYSQIACDRIFDSARIMFMSDFNSVFTAVERGLCEYGVVPLENSTAGSVKQVYDLMMKHRFSIVRSVRVKIDHSLVANKGAKLEDIKEIFSHEQAINQSSEFLSTLKGVKITPCENTAVAARRVAESGRTDIAALSSHSCIKLFNLECLKPSVQNQGNNYTRFICISKNLEIYPGADRTSLMATLPHEPGALYKLLGRLYARGINLNKLESRPIPERDFEFMFYLDIENSVYSPKFLEFMSELESICETYTYLGSYHEII